MAVEFSISLIKKQTNKQKQTHVIHLAKLGNSSLERGHIRYEFWNSVKYYGSLLFSFLTFLFFRLIPAPFCVVLETLSWQDMRGVFSFSYNREQM